MRVFNFSTEVIRNRDIDLDLLLIFSVFSIRQFILRI